MPEPHTVAQSGGLDRRLGDNAWCRWHECRGCSGPREFADHDDAVRWLQGLALAPTAMIELRAALAGCAADPALSRTSDPQAIRQLAALLVTQQVRICGTPVEAPRPQLRRRRSVGTAASGVSTPAPLPPSPRRAAPPPPAEEEAPPELDVAAMVEVLRSAASDGVPFCEECARARQAAA